MKPADRLACGSERCVLLLSFGVLAMTLGGGKTALAQVITEFPLPTANTQAFGITAGPDGNVWFTQVTAIDAQHFPVGSIGRISPAGLVREFPLPFGPSSLRGITVGPDGALWFPEVRLGNAGQAVGRISTSGLVIDFPIPGEGARDIVAGRDGNLWFTEGDGIGRVTTSGEYTHFGLVDAGSQSLTIAAGADGNLWFTEIDANRIGRITPSGAIAEFPIPTSNSYPLGIAPGPDGNIWFTEWVGNKIAVITSTGVITEYPVPTPNSEPADIVAASGALWFTEELGNKIGRITTSGDITEFALPSPRALPTEITAGSDGNIWFIELDGQTSRIGRVATSMSPMCTPDAHALCLNGSRFSVAAAFTASADGPSVPASAVTLTDDAGYFWFFSPSNVEVVVKVLKGCGVNANFWVFAGGLTNVAVDLTVTDNRNGVVRTYSNPWGTAFQPIQDTSAFACP